MLAKVVEVVPFVFMVDIKVFAKIVEVVPFVFMVDIKVFAKVVEVVPFVFMVDAKSACKGCGGSSICVHGRCKKCLQRLWR